MSKFSDKVSRSSPSPSITNVLPDCAWRNPSVPQRKTKVATEGNGVSPFSPISEMGRDNSPGPFEHSCSMERRSSFQAPEVARMTIAPGHRSAASSIAFNGAKAAIRVRALTSDITGAARLHRAASVLMDGLGLIDRSRVTTQLPRKSCEPSGAALRRTQGS